MGSPSLDGSDTHVFLPAPDVIAEAVRVISSTEPTVSATLSGNQSATLVLTGRLLTAAGIEDATEIDDGDLEAISMARLMELVAKPFDKLPESKRMIRSRVYTGADIVRAIPNKEAFLAEVDLQVESGINMEFLGLNSKGQLLMCDSCDTPYGLNENASEARIRQTRIIYEDTNGEVKVLTGEDFYKVHDTAYDGRPSLLEVSDLAKDILRKNRVLMTRGIPTFILHERRTEGELLQMFDAQKLSKGIALWVEDPLIRHRRSARVAETHPEFGSIYTTTMNINFSSQNRGSLGVLRVNLDF